MKKKMASLMLALAMCLGLTVSASAYDMGKAGESIILSTGQWCTAAVDANGSLWIWGRNYSGYLVNGSKEDSLVPVKVMDSVASVSYVGSNAVVLKTDGSIWMWGNNQSGQLGNGTKTDSSTPVKVMDGVTTVSGGGGYTAAIKSDGSLWTWGWNGTGALGNGGKGNDQGVGIGISTGSGSSEALFGPPPIQTVPMKVMDNVVAVGSGGYHTAAIKSDGSLWTWGANHCGHLGNGSVEPSDIPVKVMDNMAAVSCGTGHTAAIKNDGSLWMWGDNQFGQLGNGGTGNAEDKDGHTIQTVPVKVMDSVAAVSCGYNHTAVVKSDGSLWMWGDNHYGQLGNGSTERSNIPVKVMDNIAAVSCGNDHTVAIKTDGSLWAWGSNKFGQLGNGGQGNAMRGGGPAQTVPDQVTGLAASVSTTAPEQPTGGLQVSDWAKDQVNEAISAGLVSDKLGADYRVNITRAQFAATAVKLYEAMSGQRVPAAVANPFADTNDAAVLQAAELGFVYGVTEDTFAPEALVTREQAASMLSRVYTKLGGEIPAAGATDFADDSAIGGWARDAVAFMSGKGIVSGSGGSFDPQGSATIEQALSIALRMYKNLK